MNLGQFLGTAGVVAGGMREAQDARRRQELEKLALQEAQLSARLRREELDRLARLRAEQQQFSVPQFDPAAMPDTKRMVAPGAQMPVEQLAAPQQPSIDAEIMPAVPAAPAAPVTAVPVLGGPRVPASDILGGRPAAGVGLARRIQGGQPTQQQIDRAALLSPFAAAADIAQAPAALGLSALSGLANVTGLTGLGGRLVNAITGEETIAPGAQLPTFSATPFTDRLRSGLRNLPAAPAEPAVPPTDQAQRLFAAMQQVESANRPGAVSPKGAVGLMQVLPSTAMNPGLGLPSVFDFAEQSGVAVGKRNKAEAERLLKIPEVGAAYGQQYMNALLQKYSGNVEHALAAYNMGPGKADRWISGGADPAKLPRETRDYVPKVLAGAGMAPAPAPAPAPAAQAAPAAPPMPAAAQAAVEQTAAPAAPPTQVVSDAQRYLANPEAIAFESQQLAQQVQQRAALLARQRNELAQLAQMYMRSGVAGAAERATQWMERINQLDTAMLDLRDQYTERSMYLQGMQGVREFSLANDPRRLSGVLTQYLGAPVGIQPRSDGTYNLFVNGKRTQTGMSGDQLQTWALRQFSPEARAAAAKSAAVENEAAIKAKYGSERAVALIKATADIQTAIIRGQFDVAQTQAKREGITVQNLGDGSGRVAIVKDGTALSIFDPNEKRTAESAGGTITLPPRAQPISLGR